jgi:hypothetical protein
MAPSPHGENKSGIGPPASQKFEETTDDDKYLVIRSRSPSGNKEADGPPPVKYLDLDLIISIREHLLKIVWAATMMGKWIFINHNYTIRQYLQQ